MNEKDIKEIIKIPEGLDNAVLKGIERGKKEKRNKLNKNKGILRKSAMVAGLTIVVTATAGIINPDLVSAIPGASKVFESFNTTLFGEPTDKYQEVAEGIEQVKRNKDATITLNEVILEDNILMMALTVESDFLRGYEGKNEGDFFYLNNYAFINGEEISLNSRVKIIDDNKGAVILSGNISDLNIGDEENIKIKISSIQRGHSELKGKWNFDIKVKKQGEGRRLKLGNKVEHNGYELIADELVISKLTNTLILKGRDTENYELMSLRYMAKDNNGKYFRVESLGSQVRNSDWQFQDNLEIKGDLSNSDYIELMPRDYEDSITENIEGIPFSLLKCTGTENSEYEKKLISREPTEEELKAGYALDKVYHYLYIDKEREFKTLEELIGTEIAVNTKESLTIKNIEATDKGTKVTFESKGIYNYNNLSQMLILDEEMKDTSRGEGQRSSAIEDESKGLYSMTLDKIDTTKKYKIAIPMMPEINESNPAWKMKIELNR